MPLIDIREKNDTHTGSLVEDYDVVYVPGIVAATGDNILKYGERRLFTSVREFKTACGDSPYTFKESQLYSSLGDATSGFADAAIPFDDVMFASGDADPGYIYAIELLNAGLNVLFERINPDSMEIEEENESGEKVKNEVTDIDEICTIANIYERLSKLYEIDYVHGLADKGNISIKYLTSGGYPTYEYNGNTIVTAMIGLAADRGDCVALIDHTVNDARDLDPNNVGSLYKVLDSDETFGDKEAASFAAMFTPAATYAISTLNKTVALPASFAYLRALASSIRSNAPWLAIAGAARGSVVGLAKDGMTNPIPNGLADLMQPRDGIAVNAITNIKPYGYTIWGNRTLRSTGTDLDATSFLNVRNLVSDIKKLCYSVARSLTFEQDNDVTWVNFKGGLAPTLDRMVSGYGITGYKIVRDDDNPARDKKGVICAKIYIYPVYPVEDFYINIVLSDEDVVVE